MGIWYMHTSIGNILGTIIPSIWATCDGPWGWSFVVPGFIIIVVSVPVFLLLVPGMYGGGGGGGVWAWGHVLVVWEHAPGQYGV